MVTGSFSSAPCTEIIRLQLSVDMAIRAGKAETHPDYGRGID